MFVDYCYVVTRHIQDGALQVTKRQLQSALVTFLQGTGQNGNYFSNSWGKVLAI